MSSENLFVPNTPVQLSWRNTLCVQDNHLC
jgi:hypothetical protein